MQPVCHQECYLTVWCNQSEFKEFVLLFCSGWEIWRQGTTKVSILKVLCKSNASEFQWNSLLFGALRWNFPQINHQNFLTPIVLFCAKVWAIICTAWTFKANFQGIIWAARLFDQNTMILCLNLWVNIRANFQPSKEQTSCNLLALRLHNTVSTFRNKIKNLTFLRRIWPNNYVRAFFWG